jgi:hypothetical protein
MPVIPPDFMPMFILFTLIGAFSSMLANRGIVIYHDGLRPIMPSLYESKDITRGQVAAVSFTLMIGFLIGYGLPFSVGNVIPLFYVIFLVTDWIGISLPGQFEPGWRKDGKSLLGFYGAGAIGGAWGALLAVGLHSLPALVHSLPVDLLSPMTEITKPLFLTFALFPVLTAAYRFGWKKGVVSLILAVIANRFCTFWFGAPAGTRWMLLAGTLVLAILTISDERKNAKNSAATNAAQLDLDGLFKVDRVKRIKQNMLPIGLLSFFIGIALNYPVLALDPPQGSLYAQELKIDAFLVLVAMGTAFFPMKFSSALVSGAMFTFSFFDAAIAVIMPNWISAGIAMALWKIAEIYFLLKIGLFVNRYPFIRSLSDDIRTSIFNVLEIGLLIGSAIVADKIAPGWGMMIVIAAWWINNYAGAPIVRMGIGPIAVIVAGILANLFNVMGI